MVSYGKENEAVAFEEKLKQIEICPISPQHREDRRMPRREISNKYTETCIQPSETCSPHIQRKSLHINEIPVVCSTMVIIGGEKQQNLAFFHKEPCSSVRLGWTNKTINNGEEKREL